MVGQLLLRVSCFLLVAGCGRLERECRGVSATANAFIAESERQQPRPNATTEETMKAELATAGRYDKLASDLKALNVESSELLPEVEHYRTLAEHSAESLRAVAAAFARGDFDAARAKRVELDHEARGEGPLVHEINETCGTTKPSPDASL